MAQTKVKEGLIDAALGGGLTLISTTKIASFTAAAGESYLVDTTSAAITVSLPGSPSVGDEVGILDYASNAATNNITLDPGTLNFRGATDDLVLSTNNQSARLIYSGATKGWLIFTEAGAVAVVVPDLTVDYLVVAGGGGGGSGVNGVTDGGGGGAGGLRTSYGNTSGGGASNETSLDLSQNTNYTVTVGAGGSSNNPGYDSVFFDLTSYGGGEGAGGSNTNDSAGDGGSGGGAANGPSSSGGSGTPNQGFDGGGAVKGGGGGAAAAGNSNTNDGNYNGGAGLAVNIISTTNAANASVGEVSGSDVYFAGGGAGGGFTTTTPGGIGGGGDGFDGASTISGENGTPNTGGGGGGTNDDGSASGGNGGSGVVILRYPDAYTVSETTSLQLTFNTYPEGSDKVTVFTGGNGTIEFTT